MRLGIVALVVLSSCAPVLAQSNFATLSGAIQDPQGGPVTGAKLSLKYTATGESRSVTVNTTGIFEIAGLKPGEYRLEVRASGFANVERTVELEVGQQMRLDLTLSVGEKREAVDIVGRAEILKTADASLGEVVETKSVEELPLNGRMLIGVPSRCPART